jgi:hypothetical protein
MLLFLLVHVLVHPMTHALSARLGSAATPVVCTPVQGDLNGTRALDNCDLCRVGQSASRAPEAARIERLTPQWILVKLLAVSYESLQIAPKLPSRAPPTP